MLIRRIFPVLLLAGSAFAEPDPAAKAKLQSMADALKALKSLSYKVECKGEGVMLGGFAPKATTTVLMQRAPDGKLWMYRVEGVAKSSLDPKPSEYLVTGDGTRRAWKEPELRKVMQRPNAISGSPTVETALQEAASVMFDAEPLAKELSWPAITVGEPTDVGGVTCDVVTADAGDGQGRPRRYYIAQTDHLPRRIEHRIEGGQMNDAQVWLLTDLKIDETIPAGSFAISTPEGWDVDMGVPPAPPPAAANPAAAPGNSETSAPPPAPRQRAMGVNPDDLAPDFELMSSTGEKVKLSALNGNVVVLDFWGTWCLPCIKAAPELQKIADEYKGKPVKVYGLAVRSADDKAAAHMKDHKLTYGCLFKADEVAKTYRVKGYPTYFVIGKSGEVVFATGLDDKSETTFAKLRTAINAGLAGQPMPKEGAEPKEGGDSKPAKPMPAEGADGSK